MSTEPVEIVEVLYRRQSGKTPYASKQFKSILFERSYVLKNALLKLHKKSIFETAEENQL